MSLDFDDALARHRAQLMGFEEGVISPFVNFVIDKVLGIEPEKNRPLKPGVVKKEIPSDLESRLGGERSKIDSPRYTINPSIVYGYGSWGVVYAGRDELTGEDVAIKVFAPTKEAEAKMPDRNLDENKAMDKEAIRLSACSRVVPRRLEVDNNGRRFIVMPHYERFLSEEIDWVTNAERWEVLPFVSYAKDIALAYKEVHSRSGLNRVHGDGHPGNFAIDNEGHLLLNDFGASTIEGMGMTESPRDNIGWFLTRAPELFHDGSHPSKQTDTYSAVALMFKMHTGVYPLEGLTYEQIRNSSSDDLEGVISERISSKVKDRTLRKFFLKGLSVDSRKRFYDGSDLSESLERALDRSHKTKEFLKYSRRFGLPALVLGGMISCGVYVSSLIPERKPIPREQVRGLLYQPGEELLDGRIVSFDAEPNAEFFDMDLEDGAMFHGFERYAKLASKNKTVAYFAKSLAQANVMGRNGERLTEYQVRLANSDTGIEYYERQKMTHDYFPTIAKSIEKAITECTNSEGRVDVEDVMVASRYGIDRVKELKAKSGSNNYSDYSSSMEKDDKKFFDYWLAYYHQDI